MAINPLTGKEEDVNALNLAQSQFQDNTLSDANRQTILDRTQGNIESTWSREAGLDLTRTELKKATVATPESLFVTKWATDITPAKWEVAPDLWWVDTKGEQDLRVTKLWEILSDTEKRSIVDRERNKIRNLQNISFEERNKLMQKLNQDITSWAVFGGETQADKQRQQAEADKARIEKQTGEAITTAEDIFRQDLERETARIQEQGQRVMDTTQRLNSLRWGGRSSANEVSINKQQTAINGLITAAQKDSDLKLQQRKMQIEGASAEAMASINNALASNAAVLNEQIANATAIQAELNDSIATDAAVAMESSLGILEAGWEDVSGIDQAKSADLWYFVNQDWSIYLNKAQNPVAFKGREVWGLSATEIDTFASAFASATVKFSDLPKDDIVRAKILAAAASKVNLKDVNSLDKLKAKRLIKEAGLDITDEDDLKLVTKLLEGHSEEEVRVILGTEDFKNQKFVAWNQKLLDDMKTDIKSFTEIRDTFSNMSWVWENYKTLSEQEKIEARGTLEQSLGIMFQKMLDPWSVVRSEEFDRAAKGQGLEGAASWFWQKLSKGWLWLTDSTLASLVKTAEVLKEASTKNTEELQLGYKDTAPDLWADPDFVDRFFDGRLGKTQDTSIQLDETDNAALWDIFGTDTTETTPSSFKTSSGFEFKEDFNKPDSTGWTNDTISFIKELEWFSEKPFSDFKQTTSWFGTKSLPWETTITTAEAEKRLNTKIWEIDSKINQVFGEDLTQNQRTALTSFMFNLWTNIFAKPESQTLKNAIINWDKEIIKQQIVLFNKAWGEKLEGLVKRRQKELDLFINS